MLPLKDNIPTDRFPVVTILLIALNVAVWVWQLSYSGGEKYEGTPLSSVDQSSLSLGAIPDHITNPSKECFIDRGDGDISCRKASSAPIGEIPIDQAAAWITLFTSMFMHGGWLHIAFNMLFLWIFGNNVEDSMGRVRFLLFYVLGGLAAVGAQIAFSTSSTVPIVGASGAIAAVLGGYLLLFPRARVLTVVLLFFFFTLIEIPALILLVLWFLLQALLPAVGELATSESGGVANFAHAAGFIFGLLTIKLFANRIKQLQPEPRPVY